MKAQQWSCVLGLLCMPAEVILNPWTVSQSPPVISLVRLNLSAEILCSTSLPNPMVLSLHGQFHGNRIVAYFSLEKGLVNKTTIHTGFTGRVDVSPDLTTRQGCGFNLRLSLLGRADTDVYYCSWIYFNTHTSKREQHRSNGTIIIVRERDPYEQCDGYIGDFILIVLSLTAFAVTLGLFIGALVLRCRRFKKNYRPTGATSESRLNRHQNYCPQHGGQQLHAPCHSNRSLQNLDFRGIL